MQNINYSNRIVFFVDVLGFKSIVEAKNGDNYIHSAEQISNMFETIASFDIYKKDSNEIRTQMLRSTRITQFSDSLIVSFEVSDPSQLFNCLGQMQWIIYNLAEKRIFLRGAAAMGDLVHNESCVFGPALNKAYELESKVAQHPRIIVKDDIIDMCANFSDSPYCIPELTKQKNLELTKKSELESIKKYLDKDGDGYFYIDYFSISAFYAAGGAPYEYIEYMDKLKHHIRSGQQNATSVSISSKYMWMKEKYNSALQKLPPELLTELAISKID